MRREANATRVGLTVVAALVVLAVGTFLIGEQSFLFTPRYSYTIEFPNTAGLVSDNPVQLSGVVVGKVDRIILSEDITQRLLVVRISLERRYAERIRQDSLARIKTLGLLGDKYIEITSGSPTASLIEPGGIIPAAPPTDVDQLIASGEDVVQNIVTTAHSLSNILASMERGEGILGELVAEREGRRITDTLVATLESVERVTERIEAGEGTVGRLLRDDTLADQIEQTVARVDDLMVHLDEGDGLASALLTDATLKDRFLSSAEDLDATLTELRTVASDLRTGDGLLPRLLTDEQLASTFSEELTQLLERLNSVAAALDEGEGTAAKLIHDPSVYQAIDDIMVGVNESKLLRWLIRNRQKAGIKKRYREERADPAMEVASPGG